MITNLHRAETLASLESSAATLHEQANRQRMGAVARLRRCFGADITQHSDLAGARECVANERGFADWASLQRHFGVVSEQPELQATKLVQRLMDNDVADDRHRTSDVGRCVQTNCRWLD